MVGTLICISLDFFIHEINVLISHNYCLIRIGKRCYPAVSLNIKLRSVGLFF